MELTKEALKKILSDVESLAFQAGDILQNHEKEVRKLKVSSKESSGVVSEADEASERFLISQLKEINQRYQMTSSFLAEEEAYQRFGNHLDSQDSMGELAEQSPCWVIDPLDGTNNFLAGLDYYAVCISLMRGKEPLLGVVYRPRTRECFSAVKGEGAWIKVGQENSSREKLIIPDQKKQLKHGLFATGFSSEKGDVFEREFELFRQMTFKARGIRRMGSAALDLCYVAKGIFDGFWERGLAPWDVAAAGLICREAGLTLSDYEGHSFHPFQSTILVSSPHLYDELLELMKGYH